jgi:hypothetical protein
MVRWLGSMLMLLQVVACADDSDNGNVKDEPQGSQLRLSSATREGEGSNPSVTEGDIKVFVTTKDAQAYEGSFNKNSTEAIWNSNNLDIKENTQYYIYGFMPNTEAVTGSIAKPAGGDYSAGADLTLSGMPVFTNEDYRVIIGVQRVTDNVTFTPATEGHYGYLSGIASQNYVNLLMGHLYSQLQLRFCVDKTYYALRCIHLKEVKLKSTYVAKDGTVTATLSLRNGKGLTGQVAYSSAVDRDDDHPVTPEEWSLLTGGNVELVVEPEANAATPVYTVLPNTVNCAHCLFTANGAYLSIETTYDVYDRDSSKEHGNLIREDCKATNKIQVSGMAPGVRKMLTLTVAPTYLYMLSDPDLDNPTIHIGN